MLFLTIFRGVVWLFVFLFISVPISFQVAFRLFLHISQCLQKYVFLLIFLIWLSLFEYFLNSAILAGSLDKKWVLYIACLDLIDLMIPLVNQGFLIAFVDC